MNSRYSVLFLVSLTVLLAACSTLPDSLRSLGKACPTDSKGALKKVNWDKAEHIRIRIRQNEYTPMVQHFVQARPYILSLVNADEQMHYFSAPGFAHAVLSEPLSPGEGAPKAACVNTVALNPGQTVQWRFIAARDGRYSFYDTAFALMPSLVPSGTIVIDEPPAYLLEP